MDDDDDDDSSGDGLVQACDGASPTFWRLIYTAAMDRKHADMVQRLCQDIETGGSGSLPLNPKFEINPMLFQWKK